LLDGHDAAWLSEPMQANPERRRLQEIASRVPCDLRTLQRYMRGKTVTPAIEAAIKRVMGAELSTDAEERPR
jgi:hypothetical protein